MSRNQIAEHVMRGWSAALNTALTGRADRFVIELDAEHDPPNLMLHINDSEVVIPGTIETTAVAETILQCATVLPELVRDRLRRIRRVRVIVE
jgi:hypothetical protein